MQKRFIIIGTSAAGIGCAHKLRQLNSEAEIILISDEPENPYNKCFLVDYLSGEKTEEQVYTLTPEMVHKKNLILLLGKRVISIIPEHKTIGLSDGQELTYNALFIGTGASPFIPPLFRRPEVQGIFTFHGLKCSNVILDYSKNTGKTALVIGGGLTGLECADALLTNGFKVSIVERNNQVLSNQVNEQGAQIIQNLMICQGVGWYPNSEVIEVFSRAGKFSGVKLASGEALVADMLIVATGQRPTTQLAQEAKIELLQRGIKTDDFMATSQPGIFAGGDVAIVRDQISGNLIQSCLWPDAMLQGMIAAFNMSGQKRAYPGAILITNSSFFGVNFASCGEIAGPLKKGSSFKTNLKTGYKGHLISGNQLKGFILIGDTTQLPTLRRAVLTKVPFLTDLDKSI